MNYRELPDITDRQKEIVKLIYQYRFINRKQLQRLFNHKDTRRINTWLRDLVTKNYLGRIYSKKLLENTKPAIYFLNNNGIIWVRYNMGSEYSSDESERLDFKHLRKFYEDKHASLTFINHCITIFEFYLQLKEVEKVTSKNISKGGKKKLEYHTETKTEMWITRQLYLVGNEDFSEIKQYIPDLFIEQIRNVDRKDESSSNYFLELFDPHMPKYAIRYRIKTYIKLKEEGPWEDFMNWTIKFPTIILIFPHHRKMNSVVQYIRDELLRSFESKDIRFLLTTYQKATTKGLTDPTIYQEIKEE